MMMIRRKHVKKFILLLTIIGSGAINASGLQTTIFKKLDPHGKDGTELEKTSLEENSKCTVCHFMAQGRLSTFKDVSNRCQKCHYKTPHKGLMEHMEKDVSKLQKNSKETITCLSCHRSHRTLLVKQRSKNYPSKHVPSSIFKRREGTKDEGRNASTSMLTRTCTDCHMWEDLR